MARRPRGLGFVIFAEDLDRTSRLSDREFRELIQACCAYMKTGTDPEIASVNVGLCYDFLKPRMEEAKTGYDARCEINRQNRNGTSGDESSPIVTNCDARSQPEPEPEQELYDVEDRGARAAASGDIGPASFVHDAATARAFVRSGFRIPEA